MDKTVLKIVEILFSITKPWQLLLVLSVTSSVLLFNVGGIAYKLGLLGDVEKFGFWLFLVFSVTTGVVSLRLVAIAVTFILRKTRVTAGKIKAVRLQVSDEGKVILELLKQFQPDSVQLQTKNPVCRELRNLELVTGNPYIFSSSEFDDYRLTEGGEIVAQNSDTSKFRQLPEHDQLEFLKSVTGLDLSVHLRPSWTSNIITTE